MLLQIQVGDENCSDDEEEFARQQDERFSRRTMSDTPLRSKQHPSDEKEHNNVNHNNNNNVMQAHENGSLLYGGKCLPLRSTWIPKGAVYRSRESFRLSGRPAMKRSLSLKTNVAYNYAGRRSNGISTVCGSLLQKVARRTQDDSVVVVAGTGVGSPSKALLKSALRYDIRSHADVSPPGCCPSPENDASSVESGSSLTPPPASRHSECETNYIEK